MDPTESEQIKENLTRLADHVRSILFYADAPWVRDPGVPYTLNTQRTLTDLFFRGIAPLKEKLLPPEITSMVSNLDEGLMSARAHAPVQLFMLLDTVEQAMAAHHTIKEV